MSKKDKKTAPEAAQAPAATDQQPPADAPAATAPEAAPDLTNTPEGLERARHDDGTFKADDPSTPDVNEAYKPTDAADTVDATEGQAPPAVETVEEDAAAEAAKAEAAARRKDLEDLAGLFGIAHDGVDDALLDAQVREASSAMLAQADALGLRYTGDKSLESRAAFVRLVNETAAKAKAKNDAPPAYVVVSHIKHNGRRYEPGEEVGDLAADAAARMLASRSIKLKE